MTNRIGLIWLLALLCVIGEGRAAVPPPSETPAKIVVSGRTSTAVDITIVKVGQEIPKTYAGGRIRNTPGFEFYVSEHYALKSSEDEAFSRMMLEEAELAYPQWVDMLGAEPPDPDTRMYMVYARNVEDLRQAMISDIGTAPSWFLGGFTTYANRSAYNLPGGGLMYHLRGLMIHENLHALNMVCYGPGGGEGMTYCGEHHVYDPEKKQLTVYCFDKAPINNYAAEGLTALRKEFIPMREAVKKFWYGGGGVGSVYHFFFFTDPDRFLKWRIWRDEFFYPDRVTNENNAEIMEGIFGSLDALNEDWKQWVSERQTTFHYRTWAFEQEGAWLWSRSSRNNDYTRTDLNVIPGQVPRPDALRMDYPRNPPPTTVGPIRRGPKNPAIGCELDLSKHSDTGRVGMAFGVEEEVCVVPFPESRLFLDTSAGQSGLGLVLRTAAAATEDSPTNVPSWKGEVHGVTLAGVPAAVTEGLTNAVRAEWRGWWQAERSGRYFIAVQGAGTHRVWIDEKPVLPHGAEPLLKLDYAPVTVDAGLHQVRIESDLSRTTQTNFSIGWLDPERPVPGSVRVLIDGGSNLVVDAMVWGVGEKVWPLPERFLEAMRADEHRLGMTVTIGRKALEVALRTGRGTTDGTDAAAMKTFRAEVPLTVAQRERLLWRKMSLLSKLQEGEYWDLQFGIQPFLDALPVEQVDLTQPAPANRWRFAAMDELETLYRAAWRLKDKSPASLLKLKAEMLKAVGRSRDEQAKAMRAYESGVLGVFGDVRTCAAEAQTKALALADLAGVTIRLDDVRAGNSTNSVEADARVWARLGDPVRCAVAFTGATNLLADASAQRQEFDLAAGRLNVLAVPCRLAADAPLSAQLSITYELTWRGQTIRVPFTREISKGK